MFKKTSILVATIILFAFTVPAAMAASAKCTVTEVKGTAVILDCGKATGKLTAGDTVKIKTERKKAIEGC